MPKIFIPTIGYYSLGPMGSPGQDVDVKSWNAVKSMVFSLKDAFYYTYRSKFKVTSSLSYSTTSDPFDIGCAGDQYCKGQITSTSNTQWKVATTKDSKLSLCEDANPPCNTKEVTTLELMLYMVNGWSSKIEAKYRVTNAQGSCPEGPTISNCNVKNRNCCQDVRYDWDGEKWVRNDLSTNPDTLFNDHTYKVDSSISMSVNTSTYGGQFLDDSNYTVQNIVQFGGDSLHLNFASDYNPTTCEKFTGKGTLSFVGKIPASYLHAQPCGTKGQAFLSETWSPTSSIALMPS